MGGDVTSGLAMRELVDAIPDCVLVMDTAGVIRFLNRAAEEQLGYADAEWAGRSVLEVIHPDDIAVVLSSMESVQTKEVGTPVEVRVHDIHGAVHWLELIGRRVRLDGDTPGIIASARNITQRRMWEVAAGDLARFQHLVQVAPAITLLLDGDGIVTSVNAAFTRILGHDPTAVVGEPLLSFVAESDVDRAAEALERLRDGERSIAFETRMRVTGDNDEARPVRFELVSHVADPVVEGIVVSGYDVTELTMVREELEYLAGHDALTGLKSRGQLVKHLHQLLEAQRPFAVLFIDLDKFKPVNDLWGHETGDEVLRQVGERLEETVRQGDLVARVGGDEFVVVAQDMFDQAAAHALAGRLEASVSQPYRLDVGAIRIGASVGIALSTHDATVATLLADADMAMYDTKSERRGSTGRSIVERKRSANERRRLVDQFALGIGRGEVVAHLQPIVEAGTRRLVGLEALARWNHPELGLLRPVAFIDLVEEAGFGFELGDAVLASACTTMAALAEHGHRPVLSVNLSVGQLTSPGIVERIEEIIGQHGLEPQRLEIEITEQAILAPLATVAGAACDRTLHALRDLGATLTLDDFGTGYSSLSHVRPFPLGALKIDRSFVNGMIANHEDRAVVEAIVGLTKALGLRSVGEGVETAEQLAALVALGCDDVQGNFIGEPMSGADVIGWITHEASRST